MQTLDNTPRGLLLHAIRVGMFASLDTSASHQRAAHAAYVEIRAGSSSDQAEVTRQRVLGVDTTSFEIDAAERAYGAVRCGASDQQAEAVRLAVLAINDFHLTY